MHTEEHNHCFIHYFGVKTLSDTLFSPPLMQPGYGARQEHPPPEEVPLPLRREVQAPLLGGVADVLEALRPGRRAEI